MRTHAASKGGYQDKDAIVEFVPVEEQHVGDLRWAAPLASVGPKP